MENRLTAFRFLTIQCRTCGCDFIITPQMQEWALSKKLSIPTHCPQCLQERKAQKQQEQATPGRGGGLDDS
jgi:hypothetical protein